MSRLPALAKCEVFLVRRQQPRCPETGITAVTRPGVFARVPHHSCTHWIELDISVTPEQIALLLHDARPKSPLPQSAATPVRAVHVLHIALPQMLHQQRGAVLACGCEQQVYVIGHEHVGVNNAAKLPGKLFQMTKIKRVIFISVEAGAMVVAPLDQMQREASQSKTRATGHGISKRMTLSKLLP